MCCGCSITASIWATMRAGALPAIWAARITPVPMGRVSSNTSPARAPATVIGIVSRSPVTVNPIVISAPIVV